MNETPVKARVLCRDIMTKNVKTATRADTLQTVARLMRDGDMGSVPVVEDGKLVGIVTDRDLVVRSIADGKDASTSIAEAMTTDIFPLNRTILRLKQFASWAISRSDGSLSLMTKGGWRA